MARGLGLCQDLGLFRPKHVSSTLKKSSDMARDLFLSGLGTISTFGLNPIRYNHYGSGACFGRLYSRVLLTAYQNQLKITKNRSRVFHYTPKMLKGSRKYENADQNRPNDSTHRSTDRYQKYIKIILKNSKWQQRGTNGYQDIPSTRQNIQNTTHRINVRQQNIKNIPTTIKYKS